MNSFKVVSPVRYNPQTSTIIVCRKAVVEVLFEDSDVSATERMKQLHHSDAFKPCANTLNHFSCKSVSNSAPVRMLIVSDSTFRNNISEYVAHLRVDVQDLDCDFLSFSAHKIYGPTGLGVLYGKEKWLNQLPPAEGGGEMIEHVSFDKTTYNTLPYKF